MHTIESGMSFLLLCVCLRDGVAKVNGTESIIHSVEREDGSGRCWNVYGVYKLSGAKFSKFVRTST